MHEQLAYIVQVNLGWSGRMTIKIYALSVVLGTPDMASGLHTASMSTTLAVAELLGSLAHSRR